jgi:membrane protein DedA with SNARE-associated domain
MGAALWAGAYVLAPWLASGQPLVIKVGALSALVIASLAIYAAATFATGILRMSRFRRRAAK